MNKPELENLTPSEVLTALEDLTTEVLELRELILSIAAMSSRLECTLPPCSSEPVH